jgi:transposase
MTVGSFVGLDVSKGGIQIAVRPTGEQWSTSGDDSGINEAADLLKGIGPELVVMEAQGGPELPLAGALAMSGLPFALVSPRNIRDFARVLGKPRSERDQAGLLAYFAELVRPEVRPAPTETIEHLKSLRRRREEVLQMLTLERGRLENESAFIQKDIKTHIYFLEKSALVIDDELSRTIRSSRLWI